MEEVIKNVKGITGTEFSLGDVVLRGTGSVLEVLNTNGNYTHFLSEQITSTSSIHIVPTLLDLFGTVPLIEFSFDGNIPPSTGSNIGKFGICHTSGSFFGQNTVVYNTGNEFLSVNTVKHIITESKITEGSLLLDENSFYSKTPLGWVAKGGTSKGSPQFISIDYFYTDTFVKSNSQVPANSKIINVINNVKKSFNDGNANLEIFISSSVPILIMSSSSSNLLIEGQYIVDQVIDINTEGPVFALLNHASASVGSGSVLVQYVIPKE